MGNKRNKIIVPACVALLLLAALLALGLGAVRISVAEIWRSLLGEGTDPAGQILLYVRLPRLFASMLAGMGLAVSGVLLQSVLANPLAAPGIIGVNAGAGLFTAAAFALLPGMIWLIPVAAFAGALLTMLLVYGIARHAGASRLTLILSGVAVSSLMTAGIHTLANLYPDILRSLKDFQTGGFAGVSARLLLPAGCVILFGLVLAVLFGTELETLSLGEETARSLGLHVKRYRFLFLSLAAAMAGAAVSFAGLLGFVGLIVPHMARLLLRGPGTRTLLLTASLLGASFLLLCDTAARTLFSPHELPAGILLAFLGAPFFLWLLYKDRRRGHA